LLQRSPSRNGSTPRPQPRGTNTRLKGTSRSPVRSVLQSSSAALALQLALGGTSSVAAASPGRLASSRRRLFTGCGSRRGWRFLAVLSGTPGSSALRRRAAQRLAALRRGGCFGAGRRFGAGPCSAAVAGSAAEPPPRRPLPSHWPDQDQNDRHHPGQRITRWAGSGARRAPRQPRYEPQPDACATIDRTSITERSCEQRHREAPAAGLANCARSQANSASATDPVSRTAKYLDEDDSAGCIADESSQPRRWRSATRNLCSILVHRIVTWSPWTVSHHTVSPLGRTRSSSQPAACGGPRASCCWGE